MNYRTYLTTLLFLSIIFWLSPITASEAQTITRKGYNLRYIVQPDNFDPEVSNRLIETFFTVYPKLVKTYNPSATKEVTITIDTAYDGVAYAHDGKIVISDQWLIKKPDDIDVITHEGMHLVQAYPRRSGPSWLTEGIADYVRHKFGVDNEGAGWSLPDLDEKHHYTNSYRITARFLDWIENNYNMKNFVKKLDKAMRKGHYTEAIWKELTGKTVDELWIAYKAAQEQKH